MEQEWRRLQPASSFSGPSVLRFPENEKPNEHGGSAATNASLSAGPLTWRQSLST